MQPSSKTHRLLRAVARWLVVVAVTLAPWLFGAAEPWAYLFLCQVVGLATAIWLFAEVSAPRTELRVPGLTLVLGVLVAYVALQAAPLPLAAVRALNPLSADIAEATSLCLDRVRIGNPLAGPNGAAGIGTLSLSPFATQRSLYLLVAYVGVFVVLANTMKHRNQIQSVAAVIVSSSFVMAVLAVVHKFSGSDAIFWFHVPRYGGNVFGPFSNRNHFAAHMNMVFGLALGLFLSSRSFHEAIGWPDWRERLAWLSSRKASGMALSAFAVVAIGGAACATLSRGGMLSLTVALGTFAVMTGFQRGTLPRVRAAVTAITLLLAAVVFWLGRGQILPRLTTLAGVAANPMADFRTIITADTFRLWLACPVTGCGFGSFQHALTMFQRPALDYRWLHAHNDWAQLLAEGGWVGASLFLLACALWIRAARSQFDRASSRARLIALGIFVGLGTIALHSLVDYSLHKPANAILLAAMAGLGMAAVHCRRSDAAEPAPESAPARGNPLAKATAVVVLLLLTAILLAQHAELRGEMAFSRFVFWQRLSEKTLQPAVFSQIVESAHREAEFVMQYAKRNPEAMSEVTSGLLHWAGDNRLDRDTRIGLATTADACAALAVCGAPADYLPWLWLARVRMAMSRWDEAELCLDRARALVTNQHEVRMFQVEEVKGKDWKLEP